MTRLSPARWMVCATLVITLVGSGCSKAPADQGSYYRMKVGLTYKGKPVDIDFVAGCNVHNGRDVSGGSIHEISGMTDLFRGVRMPEGHAVVINTYPSFEDPHFNPCDGDTTDHAHIATDPRIPDYRVPKDWLPFIEWFERDDEFAHGIGYLTQDAYENKNARFGFRYARIEHATREEFEAFRKTGPANLLPPHQTDWVTGGDDPIYWRGKEVPDSVRANPSSGWWKTSGRSCKGVIRWRPTEAQRFLLGEAWPGAWAKERPIYWTPADGVIRYKLAADMTKPHESYPAGQISITRFEVPYSSQARAQQPPIFPVVDKQAAPYVTPTTSPVDDETALIGDGETNRGFVFCDVDNLGILEAVIGSKWQPGYNLTIDGTPIFGPLPGRYNPRDFSPLFQRNEYVITYLDAFRA